MSKINPKDLPDQVILSWDWDKIDVQEDGFQRVELEAYIRTLLSHNYWIVSIVVTEYDETGFPMHALIVVLPPEDGKLHL